MIHTENLNLRLLWVEWKTKMSLLSLSPPSPHSLILKCLRQRTKKKKGHLNSHNSSVAVGLITKKTDHDLPLFLLLVCFISSLLKTFNTLFKTSLYVNLTSPPMQPWRGHDLPKVTNEHHHVTHRDGLCFFKTKWKQKFFLKREINSSKRQLRPMSTREELQAEHVAQITEQLRSRGGSGRGEGFRLWKAAGEGWGRAVWGAEERVV